MKTPIGTHTCKPSAELQLGQPIGASPKGLTMKLVWVYGSWAPKSVQ